MIPMFAFTQSFVMGFPNFQVIAVKIKSLFKFPKVPQSQPCEANELFLLAIAELRKPHEPKCMNSNPIVVAKD